MWRRLPFFLLHNRAVSREQDTRTDFGVIDVHLPHYPSSGRSSVRLQKVVHHDVALRAVDEP